MNRFLTAAFVACLAAGSAQAATITETGDSFGSFSSPFAVSLVPGSSTISGSLSTTCSPSTNLFADCSDGNGDQIDSVDVSLPSGFEITNLVLTISNFTSTINDQLGFGRLGFFDFDTDGVFQVTDIANALLFGRFTFEAASGTAFPTGPSDPLIQGVGDISFSYSASFDVTPVQQIPAVPLPAGLPLLLTALAGIGLLARRRAA